MDELREVFQCSYCGKEAPLSQAALTWVPVEETPEKIVFVVALTDNPYCGAQIVHTSIRAGAR